MLDHDVCKVKLNDILGPCLVRRVEWAKPRPYLGMVSGFEWWDLFKDDVKPAFRKKEVNLM